ncbi:hypothetical protein CDAR_524231 [Caerostris darwini]|uniref:Uncharacterized protein n=1 Tax=Caerostris darwini TaxID=1538125 RepID=A0AAV4NY26_9ARAC|nr:hypothetical protein CDAR_524231 [Caerostris darwini]
MKDGLLCLRRTLSPQDAILLHLITIITKMSLGDFSRCSLSLKILLRKPEGLTSVQCLSVAQTAFSFVEKSNFKNCLLPSGAYTDGVPLFPIAREKPCDKSSS